MKYYIYISIRIILFPFFRYFLPLISQKANKRLLFELRNEQAVNNKFSVADYAFEVSSEGELEQVKTILYYLLDKNKKVELIFCSESVEHRCVDLAKAYPNNLKIFRLPILSFSPFNKKRNSYNWLTAKHFIMCRYDFFPELIFYGAKKDITFNLLSGASQNHKNKSFINKVYLSWCYQLFDKIVAVTKNDELEFINEINIEKDKVELFDFRITNIRKRLLDKEFVLESKFPIFKSFSNEFNLPDNSSSVIFGSYWDHEVEAFGEGVQNYLDKGKIICLAPHQLSSLNIEKITNELKNIGIEVYTLTAEISDSEFQALFKSYKKKPGIWLFNVKGVLCELYASFTTAYVGGGFGDSVHSLLEPYLAGAYIFTGPNVARSSEYTLILNYNQDRIVKVDKLSDLLNKIDQQILNDKNLNIEFKNQFVNRIDEVIAWLNLE